MDDLSTVLKRLPNFDVEESDRHIADCLHLLNEREQRMKQQYSDLFENLRDWISESFEMERRRALTLSVS